MKSPTLPPDLALLLTLGWSLAVWLAGGVLAGRWVGNTLTVEPWGTLCGAVLGLSGAGVTVYRVVRRLDDRAPKKSSPESHASESDSGIKTKNRDRNLP